jgi:T-complex protein 1 subunit gamma
MSVARNVVFNPMLAPGGGATEMAISVGLQAKARSVTGVEGWPFRAVADAMEVIPRTLVQNSGGNAIRVLTELRVGDYFSLAKLFADMLSTSSDTQAKHVNGEHSWGVNGETGKIVDMKTYGLYESASVKVTIACILAFIYTDIIVYQIQTLKTAIEVSGLNFLRWISSTDIFFLPVF